MYIKLRIAAMAIFFLIIFLFAACKKENETLHPSGLDTNWLTVTDNPSDSLDHLIYTLYQSTGVPIYYRDTVPSAGRSLDVFYTLTGTADGAYCVPSMSRSDLLLGVEFLRDRVFPLLTKASSPKSFYLVDSIYTDAWNTAPVYRGYLTTAVAGMNTLSGLSDSALAVLAGTIGGGEVASYLVTNYPLDLAKFYAVSNSLSSYSMYNRFESPYANPPATDSGQEFGFLTVTLYAPQTYTTPTQVDDVSSYIVAIKTQDEQTFLNQYAAWPLVLQKYQLMQTVLKMHGL